MKRIITPGIFLAASILERCAQDDAAPTAPGNDELAGEHGQSGETPMADAAHDSFGFLADTFVEELRTADQGFLRLN